MQSKLGLPVLLAVPLQVTLYLTELMEFAVLEAHSASAMESTSCSIQWGHDRQGRNGLTYHLLLGKGRCRGYLKKASKARPAKQLLKHDSIAEITLSLNSASASLAVIRLLLVLLGRYRYTFGISEVLSIRVRDVSIFDFMKVYLIMRKNDQYRDGHISVIDNWCRETYLSGGDKQKETLVYQRS